MVKIDDDLIGSEFVSDKEDCKIRVVKDGIEVLLGKKPFYDHTVIYRFDALKKDGNGHAFDHYITHDESLHDLMKSFLVSKAGTDDRRGTVFQYYGYFTRYQTKWFGLSAKITESNPTYSFEKVVATLENAMENVMWGFDLPC